MTWVRLDDGIRSHPKILAAGPVASWLFVAGLSYSSEQLTDGFLPTAALAALVPNQSTRATRTAVEALLRVGLWEESDGGYQIHDYHDYQPAADQVRARRADTADRVRRFRQERNAVGNALHACNGNAGVTNAPARPVPASTRKEEEAVAEKPAARRPRRLPAIALTDEQFLESLRANDAFRGLDIDRELAKMDAHILANPHKTKSRRFVVNWLSRAERPMAMGNGHRSQSLGATRQTAGNADVLKRALEREREQES